MKLHRLRSTPRENASKGHVKIFNLVKELCPHHKIYQEYPYSKILSRHYKKVPIDNQDASLLQKGNSLHADIYDMTTSTIIEVQGEQHYRPIRWSNKITEEEAQACYEAQVRIDKTKKLIAKEAHVKLIEIRYDLLDKLTKEDLFSILTDTEE